MGKSAKVLMLASVASMIDLFNKTTIAVLEEAGCLVDIAANFQFGSITSQIRVDEYKAELQDCGKNVYDIPIPRSVLDIKNIIRSYRLLVTLSNEKHYDIVHVHSPIGGILGRLAFRKSRRTGTKVMYTAHGFHFYIGAPFLNWILFYPLEKWCSRYTDVLITINQEDYLRSKSFYALRNEFVPGIGINVDKISKTEVNKNQLRNSLGLRDDDFVVMSTGQLSVRKNHQVIIRAISRLHNPKIKYLIVGFGELEDMLRTLAIDMGIEKQVIFAGYRSNVNELLHIADAFALPSLQEGLSVALMEAMAAGLPVVCSKIRGNVDLIEDCKGGFLYDVYDEKGFAEGIKMLYDSRLDKTMGLLNLERARCCDATLVANKMERIYRAVLES